MLRLTPASLCLFALCLLSPFGLASPQDEAARSNDAPLNVLWLTVEDMSPWIGAYGQGVVPTPHLDAFAQESMRYDQAFADSPVCAPARTALITGVYPTRMGAMHMRTRSRSKGVEHTPLYEAVPAPHVRCFPEDLRMAGYYTSNRSKTDYQFKEPAWTWNDSGRNADYENRPAGSPFFSVINHTGTHESQAFPKSRKRPVVVTADDVPVPPIYPDTPAVRDALARTHNNIAEMDRWVGKQLARLEAAGLADSTVVFFYSDHGVGLPRGKRSLYGTGTRVPLLVRFPSAAAPEGWTPGGSTDRIVSFIDLGPTALSLAGIEPDPRLDGRAFLGPFASEPKTRAFFHADRFDGVMDRARAVTDGTRLVIRNYLPEVPHLIANTYRENLPMTQDLYDLRDGGPGASDRTPAQWQTGSTQRPAFEWYDRTDDPWEIRNLAGSGDLSPEDQAAFEGLARDLEAWTVATGDLGLIESELEMIKTHLWSPNGEQPTTAAPKVAKQDDGEWTVSCETPGASIGYRAGPNAPWQPLGRGPGPYALTAPSADAPFEFMAHRAGFAPSSVVSLTPKRKE